MFIFRNIDEGNVYLWIKEIEQFMKKIVLCREQFRISLNNLETTTCINVEDER